MPGAAAQTRKGKQMPSQISALRVPDLIRFGCGAGESVSNVIRGMGCEHALIVTDANINRVGIIAEVETWLKEGGVASTVWDDVKPEPLTGSISQGVEVARATGCDLILGIGGGSAIDVAKAVAVMLTNDGAIEDFLGNELVERRGLPTVMMPTTSGTGAEITLNAIFYVEAERAKKAIISAKIIPDAAIVDPALTLSLPPDMTAATGFDALCHAVECYTSKNASPFSDVFSLEAIRLIGANLREAVHNGSSLSAREAMAQASMFGGMAIAGGGTNAVHALAYPLQSLNRIAHGIANAVLLPYVMEYNLVGDVGRFAAIAEALGVPTAHLSPRSAAQAGVDAVRELSEDIGLPQRIGNLGVTADQIPDLVSGALQVTRLLMNNPREVTAEDAEAIFQRAL